MSLNSISHAHHSRISLIWMLIPWKTWHFSIWGK